jgi:hypothetical protein
VDVREVAVALVQVEAVADEELVGNGEADVAHREVLDEAAIRAVEQGDGRHRARVAEQQRLAQVVHRQPGVDDVLDDQDVAAVDAGVEILEQPDSALRGAVGAPVIGRKLDEVEVVEDRRRAREIGEEDEAGLERRDEQRLEAVVVGRDLRAELRDAALDLLAAEVDLANAGV